MRQKLTFNIERDGNWFVGSCLEVPGANGQGRTLMSCSRNLVQAVATLLDEEDPPQVSSTTVRTEVLGAFASFPVELTETWEGFSVSCPDLPGCFSQGDDEEEALQNIQGAIKDYVEVAEEMKHPQEQQLVKVA